MKFVHVWLLALGCHVVVAKEPLILKEGEFPPAGTAHAIKGELIAIRGHSRAFDWISRYRILENGEVALLGLTPADKIPWGFALSPYGSFLVVSAWDGATLTAYRISETGELTEAASLATDKNISDLVTR